MKYCVVKSHIDGKYRVMETAEAPYGTAFSVGDTIEDAIHDGARMLDISEDEIEVWE